MFLSRRNRILFYNSSIWPHLDFCCIIWGNCSSTLEDKLVKFQKSATRVILDCDFYTPSSELFKEFNGATIPERVTYQKAMLMYRIVNNICPDYLKKLCLIYFLTYHVEILDLLTVTTYIRQNLTANLSASPSCTLEIKWKRFNGHWIISITTANLFLYFVLI